MSDQEKIDALEKLLDNKHIFDFGLCFFIMELSNMGVLNKLEYDFIKSLIPKSSTFIWPQHEWEPREQWIKAHIKILRQ